MFNIGVAAKFIKNKEHVTGRLGAQAGHKDLEKPSLEHVTVRPRGALRKVGKWTPVTDAVEAQGASHLANHCDWILVRSGSVAAKRQGDTVFPAHGLSTPR